ncbi:hypothetical protein D3C86_2083690 [compost metagenome]
MYSQMKSYYNRRDVLYHEFEEKMSQRAQLFRVPDLVKDISDLSGLMELGDVLKKGEKKS